VQDPGVVLGTRPAGVADDVTARDGVAACTTTSTRKE
jgi:hypothetical protein